MNEDSSRAPGQDGYQVYTARTLRTYDLLVHGFSNHLAWKCPTREIRNLYRESVGRRHLEIGVGTGLFLDRLDRLDSTRKFDKLVLADPNQICLDKAVVRLRRFNPESIELNLLDPASLQVLTEHQFDSIGLNYVLHCLPNGISNLSTFLPQLERSLADDATFFGSTILGDGYRRNWLATRLMSTYNRHGIFGNLNDRRDDLELLLSEHFVVVDIRQIGCVAIFTCRQRFRASPAMM